MEKCRRNERDECMEEGGEVEEENENCIYIDVEYPCGFFLYFCQFDVDALERYISKSLNKHFIYCIECRIFKEVSVSFEFKLYIMYVAWHVLGPLLYCYSFKKKKKK